MKKKNLEIIFQKPKRIVDPINWIQHIPFSFYLLSSLKPKLVVELGTHSGNSFCAFNQAVKFLNYTTTCIAIDSWEGDVHSGKYGNEIYDELLVYCKNEYPKSAFLKKKYFRDAVHDFECKTIDLLHRAAQLCVHIFGGRSEWCLRGMITNHTNNQSLLTILLILFKMYNHCPVV